MSEQKYIGVVVDGIRCTWQVMTSFDEHGYGKLVCRRYASIDCGDEERKKVEKSVPVPMPSHTMEEDGAIDTLAEVFRLDEAEEREVRILLEKIKWNKSAYKMLQNLAEEDKK